MDFSEIQAKIKEKGKATFRVKVSPGANKTEWQKSLSDGTYKLKVKAAPEKGRANNEVLEFIASSLGLPKKRVEIIHGGGARVKWIKIKKI
jgi:uncharacterized protein YggU (UPF0235/DUF167 family)